MGMWFDTFVAPVEPVLPDRETFGRLVLALGRERIVRMPWFMLGGTLDINRPLLWSGGVVDQVWNAKAGDELVSEDREQDGEQRPERATVLARGENILRAVSALAGAPYGEVDLAVVFACLNFDNPAIREHYLDVVDWRTRVVCYALRVPQHRVISGAEDSPKHAVQTVVVNTFKHGNPEPCPAVEAVVSTYVGRHLISGYLYD